jgi:DNA-binding MarR family transcriptional regulator
VLELTPIEKNAWRAFVFAHSRVADSVDQSLRSRIGLGLGDYEVLSTLYLADDNRMRMSELAGEVALSRSGLTRQVDRLVRRGLIERHTCQMDRRGLYAALTPSGIRAVEHAAPVHREAIRAHFTGQLNEIELRSLTVSFEKLLRSCPGSSEARRGEPEKEPRQA